MVFGSLDDFAIEAMVEPGLEPPSAVWGRLRVWCQGVSFGDFDEPSCALWPPYHGLQRFERELRGTWPEDFSELSDLERMKNVDALLYEYQTDELASVGYGKYAVLKWGEMFNRTGRTYVFPQTDGPILLLSRDLFPRRLFITAAAVSLAVAEFVDWFGVQTARLEVS